MGMFDWVDYKKGRCPSCKFRLFGWQSKDGECVLNTVKPKDVLTFHTICNHCGKFVEAKVSRGKKSIKIALTVEGDE